MTGPVIDDWTKGVIDRIVDLIKEDPPLHDAVVRFINARAEDLELANARRKKR